MSRFLPEWYFCAKVFCAPGSKNVLSYYFLTYNCTKTNTTEKIKLNSSCEAAEKITVQKQTKYTS